MVAYVRYLGKAFWPTRLAALYPHPGSSLSNRDIFVSSAILLFLTVLVLYWRDRRCLAMGWFWFLGTLVPVIGLVQVGVQAMADRYAYIPYIGLFVLVVWGVAEFAQARAIPTVWLGVPAVLVLATFGALSSHQIAYWHDSETFWRHILSVTDLNYTAHDALARALGKEGRIEEAMVEFNAAESVHQYAAADMVEVAIFEQTHGHVQEAVEQYTRALDAAPDSKTRAVVLSRLGSAFTQMGDIVRAKQSYTYALRENPDNSSALVASGLLAERDGDVAFALTQISHAMKVESTDVGYLLLGQALRRAGRGREADDAFAHAQQISHDFAKAQESAAKILTSAGIKPE
jgi:Tfp pilus assembly protein PilF